MLKLEIIPVGPLSTNCVLVWDPETMVGMVVDPGDEASKIKERVETLGFRVDRIVQTHAHFDHLGATKELQELWMCPAYLHASDHPLVELLGMQTAMFGMKPVATPSVQATKEGDVHHGLRLIHTPGHSPGSCGLFGPWEGGDVLLSGDTLFMGGVGRTDALGGSWEAIQTSVLKLYDLPEKTRVIPGHGPETSIGKEARTNPFVRR